MRSLLILLFLLSLAPATAPKLYAQGSKQDTVLAEGKALYRLEKTAWNIWDIERNTMAVLTRKAMEKIKKRQKKLAKKRKRQKGN